MGHQPRAAVVGSGPNGLTAAARLAVEGWRVDIYERSSLPGGAATSSRSVFEGTIVDMGAAAHPFGAVSPAFHALRLSENGLSWKHAPYEVAHPLEGQDAALLSNSLDETAYLLGTDSNSWSKLHRPIVNHLDSHLDNLLRPFLRWPKDLLRMIEFGFPASLPATSLGKIFFTTEKARALLAGNAVHAITSPARPLTSAFGLLFGALGMTQGWPVPEGGTQEITNALLSVIHHHGGRVHVNSEVTDLNQLPPVEATILNLTPRQVLAMDSLTLAYPTRRRFKKWKYGIATHKVDFLLREPVPWSDPRVGQAGTVHVAGSVREICLAEEAAEAGKMPARPFVMVCQQYAADPSRGLTLWTYAHVPHGYIERFPGEVRELIIQQIERFAPGFRDVILDTHEQSPSNLEEWNSNLIGGDIAGGAMTGLQTLIRPTFSTHPHCLGKGLYLASSSTPPGAGVHGMPGWIAAGEALTRTPGRHSRKGSD